VSTRPSVSYRFGCVSFKRSLCRPTFRRADRCLAIRLKLSFSADGVNVPVGAEIPELTVDGGVKPPGSERHQMGLASVR
jgi:hypothetical protein